MNLNGTEYYYVRNGQGDIIGLLDETGKQIVAYTYNSWGKLLSIDGDLKDTIGVKNPYRYRGYRYDTETGLYYLQSRYYNPEWSRFINGDIIIGITGKPLSYNLFAYCTNDPINYSDPNGYYKISIKAKYLAKAIDLALIIVPGIQSIKEAMKIAKLTEQGVKVIVKSTKGAFRKALFTEIPKTWLGVISNALITIVFETSIGTIISNVLDKLDGKKDGYVTVNVNFKRK